MNNVVLMGRLVADPETYYSTGENATATTRFTVAINRTFKNAEGKYDADFIRCVAFKQHAEFVSKYFHKGDMIALDGYIHTGSYTNKDGQKVYTTDVYINHVEFCGSKSAGTQQAAAPNVNNFINQGVGEGENEENLPF